MGLLLFFCGLNFIKNINLEHTVASFVEISTPETKNTTIPDKTVTLGGETSLGQIDFIRYRTINMVYSVVRTFQTARSYYHHKKCNFFYISIIKQNILYNA